MSPKDKQTTTLIPAPSDRNGFSLISSQKLLEIYAAMVQCRILGERAHKLLQQNTRHGRCAAIGLEAATVGVAIDLLAEDTIAPPPGSLIPPFLDGSPLQSLFRARVQPISSGASSAAQLKNSTQAAMDNKLKSNNKIAVALSAGAAPALGAWNRALSYAGRHDLPLIFVSWNHCAQHATTHGFPAIAVDGNDVVAVYRVASEAIALARRGSGPTLIACQTDGLNHEDPILNMEQYLQQKGLFSEGFKKKETARFTRTLDSARA